MSPARVAGAGVVDGSPSKITTLVFTYFVPMKEALLTFSTAAISTEALSTLRRGPKVKAFGGDKPFQTTRGEGGGARCPPPHRARVLSLVSFK